MARSDLLLTVIQAGLSGDKIKLKKAAEAIIAEERAKHHKVLASRLEGLLHNLYAENSSNNRSIIENKITNLVYELIPEKNFRNLILPNEVIEACNEVVHEQNRSDLLRSYNIEPRNRILLIGSPGNGKTTLAEAIAESLMVPLFIVRYENIIGTYLGETAFRLRSLIDYACTRKCVLFFDEFETLAKERGDTHETGEIKRVVSSLLMQVDSLPSHVVVIGATNHPELLDRAVWRRFQVRIELPSPTKSRLKEWFKRFEEKIKISLGHSYELLAKNFDGYNFSEVEEFGRFVFRQYVLTQPNSNMKEIVSCALKNWEIITANAQKGKIEGR